MNRRQFLTGASALAVSAAIPTAPVALIVAEYVDTGTGSVVLKQIYWQNRYWWISGVDNIIHFSEPGDSAFFSAKLPR